jgi:hypothetical protein
MLMGRFAGYLMWFAVFASGIGGLGTAILYLIRPTEGKLALMRPFSLAAIFSAVSSSAAGGAIVLQGLAASGPNPDMSNVMMGWAETLVPIYVAFAFLGLAWLLVAVGLRRAESRAA